MYLLDEEEKNILESFENDEWQDVPDTNAIKKYQEAAINSHEKEKRISINLSQNDFEKIQKKALKEGIPYKNLITGIIHKYLSNRLIEQN